MWSVWQTQGSRGPGPLALLEPQSVSAGEDALRLAAHNTLHGLFGRLPVLVSRTSNWQHNTHFLRTKFHLKDIYEAFGQSQGMNQAVRARLSQYLSPGQPHFFYDPCIARPANGYRLRRFCSRAATLSLGHVGLASWVGSKDYFGRP